MTATTGRRGITSAALILVATVVFTLWSGRMILSGYEVEPIVKGPSVTEVKKLSDYFSDIAGTAGDTDVYILDSGQPGGTVLMMGGLHATEVSGMLTSAFSSKTPSYPGAHDCDPAHQQQRLRYSAGRRGLCSSFHVDTEWGERWFRLGDRLTSPVHQWPDPEAYAHYPSGQILSGSEVRNLNRCFPGARTGSSRRRWRAITQLIQEEECDLVIDLHEASAMPVVNVIVAHENAIDIAGITSMTVEFTEGFNIGVEASPQGLRGLSHREIGDHTQAKVLLMETPNPMMDWVRGKTTEELLLTGKDEFMTVAANKGLVRVPYDENGLPIEMRVGRHSSSVQEVLNTMSMMYPDTAVQISGVPKYADLMEHGLGHFLKEPSAEEN